MMAHNPSQVPDSNANEASTHSTPHGAASDLGANLNLTAVGVVIVDHGSRRAASNDMLLQVVELYREQTPFQIVEPAHMELAEPSIATAFDRCVAQGAQRVIVMPYFLLPGRHWNQDIPELTQQAAQKHPDVSYVVTAPLGLSSQITSIIDDRIGECLRAVQGTGPQCSLCQGTNRCQRWHTAQSQANEEANTQGQPTHQPGSH